MLQAEQRGTGHALMVAREALASYDEIIVLSGDAPLISPQTIRKLRDFHSARHPAMTILTAQLQDPTGYGRVIRKNTKSPDVKAIVEEKVSHSGATQDSRDQLRLLRLRCKTSFRTHRRTKQRQSSRRVLSHRHGCDFGQGKEARGGGRGRVILMKSWAATHAPRWWKSISTCAWPSAGNSWRTESRFSILKPA